MIDEKKLIKDIKHFQMIIGGLRSGRSLLNEYANTLRDGLLEIIEQQPKVREWVPVSERLPEEKQYYFVTYKVPGLPNYCTTETYFGSLSDGTKKWEIEEEHSNYKVIAWMERPEPYIPPEETQLCTNKECTYNADHEENINCPAWNGCGGFQGMDLSTFIKSGNNREEAYADFCKFEAGFDEKFRVSLSYEEFCSELDKGYGNSDYIQVARLYEDENGVIWYDNEYIA